MVSLVASGLGAGVLTSCCSDTSAVSEQPDVALVHADYYADDHGVMVGIRVGYEEARTMVGARMLTGDESMDISLYPLDGTDPDVPPETIALAAGDQVLLEGMVLVPCRGDSEPPVFAVDSESDGSTRTDHFAPANPVGYRRAVADTCDRPLTMHVTGSSATPDGEYELRVEFVNPGPDAVTVTSERVDDGTSRWQETAVVVAPGSVEPMTITGHGPPNCGATPPWESGHVRAGDDVVRPEYGSWC